MSTLDRWRAPIGRSIRQTKWFGRTPTRLASPIRTGAVVSLVVLSYLPATLVPLLMTEIQHRAGFSTAWAGTVITAMLLAGALSSLVSAGWANQSPRLILARSGLAAMAGGYLLAALTAGPPLVTGLVFGGAGAGVCAAAGGGAMAVVAAPGNAASLVALTIQFVPLPVFIGLPLIDSGHLASCLLLVVGATAGLALTLFLPTAPAPPQTGHPENGRTDEYSQGRGRRYRTHVLVICAALWAVGQDSLWALSSTIGVTRAGLTEHGIGLALGLAALAGAGAVLVRTRMRGVGDVPVVIIAFALAVPGELLICQTNATVPFELGLLLWSLSYPVTLAALLGAAASLDSGGRCAALVSGSYLIGAALSPMAGGATMNWMGASALGFGAIFTGLAVLVILVLSVPPPRNQVSDGRAST